MSIPSSSDEVATSARSCPALSASSISTRCSRAIEPWCERTSGSPASSLSAAGEPLGEAPAVHEEQRGLVRADQLEQARVDARPDRRAHRALRRRPARDVAPRSPSFAMSSTGTSTVSASAFGWRASTIVTGRQVTGGCSARELMRAGSRARPRALPLKRWSRRARVRGAGRHLGLAQHRSAEETARPRRAGAAWPTGRCAAGAHRDQTPRAARARARGARRAWWARARGSRRR